jgi:hypothetical protein
MSDVRSSQPIQSLATSNSVKVSADLNANAVGNPIFVSGTDGVNQLDYVVIDSAYGATPVATPIAGKYEATPTTYADGDATALLTDVNGRLEVVATLSGGGSGGTSSVDDSAFTIATDRVTPISGIYQSVFDSVDDGDTGAVRMTADRVLYSKPYDGVNELDYVVVDSAYGATPVVMPIAGKYQATPTTYADGDATAILTSANGKVQSIVSANDSANAETNPIFVQVVDGALSGIEVVSYNTAVDVAVDGTDNHDYTVTATKTLKVLSVSASSAQPLKVEVQSGPVAGLATAEVQFSSAANRNVFFDFAGRLEVPDTSTGTLRVIRKNIGDSASDVYSTIVGSEV